MSQALPVPSVTTSPVTVCASPQAAESANSGQSFSETLSGELGAGDAPGETANASAPGPTSADGPGKSPGAAALAAGGNGLPPTLPPEAMLAVSVLMPAAAQNPVATATPSAAVAKQGVERPSDLRDSAASDTAPVPASATVPAAIPVVAFVLPAPAPSEPTASSAAATTASVGSTASAPKPDVLSPRASAAISAQSLAAASAHVDADPSTFTAATNRTGSEQVSAMTDSLKAVTTPAHIEPTLDARPLPTPMQVNVEPMAALATVAQGAASTTPNVTVSVPFGQPAWGEALGNQVVWAVNQGLPAAALHLSPPELGPVSVHIRLDQDQASIAFSSPHAAVREAIDAAMPRLRDMLGNQGIALVDVNVSQHGSSQAYPQARDNSPGSGRTASAPPDDRAVTVSPIRQAVLGVLDLYA